MITSRYSIKQHSFTLMRGVLIDGDAAIKHEEPVNPVVLRYEEDMLFRDIPSGSVQDRYIVNAL